MGSGFVLERTDLESFVTLFLAELLFLLVAILAAKALAVLVLGDVSIRLEAASFKFLFCESAPKIIFYIPKS
jgi:hypothetical protein